MKKISVILLCLSLLAGCAGLKVSESKNQTSVSDGVEQYTEQNLDSENKLSNPVIKVAKDFAEGEFSEKYANGSVKFKTYVQNGCFDKYIDVFYPNGQLNTHTPLFNCKANGLAQSYTEKGALKTETPYVDGYAHGESRLYNQYGKVAKKIYYSHGSQVENKKAVKSANK